MTNNAHVKEACSAVDKNFRLDSMATFVVSVEQDIERLLGDATCEAILADAIIVNVIRRCVVDLALAAYTSSGALQISDVGIQVATGNNRAPASDKKLLTFKRDATERGWLAFEQVVLLLERHRVSAWLESEERVQYFSVLFSSSSEFGPFGGVAVSASVYMRFRNTIVNVQDDQLVPVLGRELLDKVIGFNTTVVTDSKDKQLQRLCMRVVAPLVVADALRYRSIELGENGVYQSSVNAGADNVEVKASVGAQVLMRTINRLTMESESCLVKLNKFLKDNSDKYTSAVAHVYPVQGLNGDRDSSVYLM